MLKLRDFVHLPQLDALIQQLVNDGPGLFILAGIDARSGINAENADNFTPSGLSAIFNILMQEILMAHPLAQAFVVSEDRMLAKVPRQFARRVRLVQSEPGTTPAQQIEAAMRVGPGLLVVDHLNGDAAQAAFHAARVGLRVLARFDTVLRGPAVVRQLVDQGVPRSQLSALRWVLTTQRMPVLCDHCKQPFEPDADYFDRLCQRYPHLRAVLDNLLAQGKSSGKKAAQFFRAGGCTHCRGSGYQGDMAVFDLFRNDPDQEDFFGQRSLLSLEEYALHLAADGQIDLADIQDLESEHLRRTYQMLTTSERALTETNAALSRKVLELEATNRVLLQRTEVLISLQDLGNALITSAELRELAARVCRRAGELCGADRVVLYLRREDDKAEVLAVRGWESSAVGTLLESSAVFHGPLPVRIARDVRIPPGMFNDPSLAEAETKNPIIMGVRVPLIAQDQQVGLMVIQSTQRDFFTPGETALVQTFANQAALAIQRAGLVDDLRAKIEQLEAAQAALVTKERMQRELELAREVQQSMLPHHFPDVPGYVFSARNEPARQVGGDFYDVILLDDHRFGVVIADVADKGMPAALYMALTRSLLVAEARREKSPREVLLNINRLLSELGELDGFVSVFYAVVDQETGRMCYTRAGHERPMLVRDGQVTLLEGKGAVLGILDGESMQLTEEQLDLLPGDRLVLFTDGMTDVANEQGDFLAHEGLERFVSKRAALGAEALCQAIFDDLAAYRGSADPFDDMTLLILEVKSNE